MGKHNSTQVDEGRRGKKELKSSRDKKCKARTIVGRREKSLLCDPGSELRLGGRENRRAKITNEMENKNKNKKVLFTTLETTVN